MADVFTRMGKLLSESISIHSHSTDTYGSPVIIEMSALQDTIRRCRTDGEMNHFMNNFIKHVQQELGHPKVTNADRAYVLQQCMLCHSLGYHVPFAHMIAIQLSQTASCFQEKLTAYTACQVFLHEESEMSIMMIATIQRDIRSRERKLVQLALTCCSHILNRETIPAILPLVLDRAAHPSHLVRRSVVACLTHFILKSPEIISEVLPTIEKAFRDTDPLVMFMALQAFSHPTILDSLADAESLIKPLISVVQQIGNGKLPRGLSRNKVPAHQILITALQLLSQMIQRSAPVNSELTQTLSLIALAVLDSLDSNFSLTGWAVKTECCLCLASLGSSEAFLSAMEHHLSKMMNQSDEAVKTVCFKILETASKVNQKCLIPHRKTIVTQLSTRNQTLATHALALLLVTADEESIDAVVSLYYSQIDCKKAVLSQHCDLDKFIICGIVIITRIPKSAQWLFEKLEGLFTKFGTVSINVLNETASLLASLDRKILTDFFSVMDDHSESLPFDLLLLFVSLPNVKPSNPRSILNKFNDHLTKADKQNAHELKAKLDWFLLCYRSLPNTDHSVDSLTLPATLTSSPYTRLLISTPHLETLSFQARNLNDIFSIVDIYTERISGKPEGEDSAPPFDEIQLAHKTDMRPEPIKPFVPLQLKTTNRMWSKKGRAPKGGHDEEAAQSNSESTFADPTEALAAQVFFKLEK